MISRLIELDASWSKKLEIAEQPGLLRTLAAILAHSGDSWFWLAGLAVLWLTGNPYWKAHAFALICGVLATALLVLAIKFTVRRRRPEGKWGGIYRSTDPHSFPSGHAVRAFMIAVMMLFLGPGWLAVVLLIWAPLVALARIAMGLHYVLDVAAGLVLGVILGAVFGAVFA